MRTGHLLTLILGLLIVLTQECRSTEPIVGWGKVKFGMSRAEVRKAYNTDEQDQCEDPSKMAPYECKSELLTDLTLAGLGWTANFYFLPKLGLSKVVLILRDKDRVSDLYATFKRDLAEKYGPGSATPASNNLCAQAGRRWDAGARVTNADWIITNQETFIIRSDGAAIILFGREQSLCGNTPSKVYQTVSGTLSLWRTLSVSYEKVVKIPNQF